MFRQIIAFLFIAAFFVQTFSKVLMVADYYSNTVAYSKNCENKRRPMLHCDGKCQLAKKLQKEAQKDEQNQERKAEKKSEVLCSTAFSIIQDQFMIDDISRLLGRYKSSPLSNHQQSIFHPPCC